MQKIAVINSQITIIISNNDGAWITPLMLKPVTNHTAHVNTTLEFYPLIQEVSVHTLPIQKNEELGLGTVELELALIYLKNCCLLSLVSFA